MDTKRKANGTTTVEADDRSSKRRKLSDFDLSKGESRDSTTAYGLTFLEQIRRTADKSGRLVATYFEKLIPREGNAEYYRRTKMPISLEIIEEKLNNGEFSDLAELESYFKRMIANAKEFYPRSSSTFDDAERVRKAVSNYMTKTNPAYNQRGYQALPTPLPPDDGKDADTQEEQAEELDESKGEVEDEEEDEDAEEDDADADAADEEADEPDSRRRSIVLKRRGPGRPPRHSSSLAQDSPRSSQAPTKPDHQYEDVPYKGLNFQQAQEKLVEELLRHREPDYDEAYFEPFINLPPRALKDYYKVVTDPLSLKKLQKSVKGVHGRNDVSGVSDFKSWSAFEEKSKLLWTNAYYYNEEGSEIYSLAQELEKAFNAQLKQAKAAVSEPSQPKIKLKVGQPAEPPASSKKITIHVGGRGGSVDSPAPQTTESGGSPANGQILNGAPRLAAVPTQFNLQLDKARSVSASVASPSPSMPVSLKAEDSARLSPANLPRPPSSIAGQPPLPVARPPLPYVVSQPSQPHVLVNGAMEKKLLRAPGKGIEDALISRLRIQAFPGAQADRPFTTTVLPHPTEMQQSVTINLPATHHHVCIYTLLPDFLQDRQYSLWTLLDKQTLKPTAQPMPGQLPQERAFDILLHAGVNVIEAHLVAATPRAERVPGGPEVELEIFTVFVNVMRI